MGRHVVVAAALVRDGEVLLCHRSPTRTWYPDVWDLPGGHVEDGETPQAALRRELTEELGVDVGDVAGPPTTSFDEPAIGLSLRLWTVTTWEGVVRNMAQAEHDQLGWFSVGQLDALSLADEAYRPFLRQLLER
jgi:mutator protein MutT